MKRLATLIIVGAALVAGCGSPASVAPAAVVDAPAPSAAAASAPVAPPPSPLANHESHRGPVIYHGPPAVFTEAKSEMIR